MDIDEEAFRKGRLVLPFTDICSFLTRGLSFKARRRGKPSDAMDLEEYPITFWIIWRSTEDALYILGPAQQRGAIREVGRRLHVAWC